MTEILVIDDDEAVRAIVVNHLARLEAKIVDMSDARDALKLITSGHFDLIICDLFMPEVDGIRFISEVRRTNANIPIILISGGGARFPIGSDNFSNLTETATLLGASQILQKPFRGEQLREMVRSLLAPDPPKEVSLTSP